MTADVQNLAPQTWMDKNTGVIYTWDILLGRWVNSSESDGKPRLLAIDSIMAEDITDGAVGTDQLADASVTVPKLAPDVLALFTASTIFIPLTTVVGGVPELVWEDDDGLALTEVARPT